MCESKFVSLFLFIRSIFLLFKDLRYVITQIFLAIALTHRVFSQDEVEDERLFYARDILEQGLQNNDSLKIAEGYYLLAKYETRMINYAEAYRLFYLSLRINEDIGDFYKIGRVFLRLAKLELDQGHFENAKVYTNEAVEIFVKHDHQTGLKSTYMLIGDIYSDYASTYTDANFKNMADSAMMFYRETEKIIIAEDDEKELAKLRWKIGLLYSKLENAEAIPYLEYAVTITQKYTPTSPLVVYQTGLAEAWLLLGKPSNAEAVLSRSQKIIDEGFNIQAITIAGHHAAYSEYYKAIRDWENALYHREEALNAYRLMAKVDRDGNISRWRVRLETEKKDLALKLHSQEIEAKQELIHQQQLFLAILILCFLLLILLSYFLYRNLKKQESLSQKNEVLMREQNHRVKNNLQVISSMLSLQHDYLGDELSKKVFSESRTRIDSMILLHRQLYENGNAESIDIEDFFYDVVNSVALSFGVGRLQTNLSMGVRFLKTDTATAIGVIINELAMNSIKHAFKEKTPLIEISSKQTKNKVEITYKDCGDTDLKEIIGNSDKKGFGLDLINMILFQINGHMKYNYLGGSVFTISFKNH